MRKATLLLPFALLTTLATGCDPDSTNSTRPVHCEVLVDAPKKAEDADKIDGQVRFKCDKPGAETLTLKVQLQKKDGEQWHSVATSTFTLKDADTNIAGWDYLSRKAQAACDLGIYRTVVDWSRVSRGNTKGDNLESGTARNPCSHT